MGIQSFVPSSGGGMPGANFIASIQMTTYNRSWSQVGGPGDYVLVSNKLSNGYAYFIKNGVTQGVPLGNIVNLPNGFSTINIVAPKDDYIMLYKVATKSTTVFDNPFGAFSSFPSVITSSGNFVLPNNALPLVNVVVCGAGGSAGRGHTSHGGGGGGAGGGVVKLTAYQAVGTTSVTIPSGPGGYRNNGGRAYFGNVYALGGGFGADHNGDSANYYQGSDVANFGGNGGYQGGGHTQVVPTAQTASTGLGLSGSPVFYGGNHGGRGPGGSNGHYRGGGGGGAGGNGGNGSYDSGGDGGAGHISDITGTTSSFGAGGQSHGAHGSGGTAGWNGYSAYGHGSHAHSGTNHDGSGSGSGVVVVRYYIP